LRVAFFFLFMLKRKNIYNRSGGDLRLHLVTQHDENTVRFWMAELICAVKYLHSQGIVHRYYFNKGGSFILLITLLNK
jgi:hypothetical protein